MPPNLRQILTQTTEDETFSALIQTLKEMGFVTASWHDGSVQHRIFRSVARALSGASNAVAMFAENSIVKPTGLWLDIVGVWRFGIERLASVPTRRYAMLSSDASASPHSIVEGSYLSTAAGVRFRVAGGPHALSPGSTITVEVIAELGGVAGNCPSTTPLSIQTPVYSGVSAAFSSAPLITVGADTESDDRYWYRCGLRWSELTYSVGPRAYELWALTAAPSLRRARGVPMYPTPYAVRVALDPGLPAEVSAVEAYIADRIPPNDVATVAAANTVTQSFVYTPRVASGVSSDTLNAAIQAKLDSLPIGGTIVANAIAGRILLDDIAEALLCSSRLGVRTVGMITPSDDVILGATDIVTAICTCNPEYS